MTFAEALRDLKPKRLQFAFTCALEILTKFPTIADLRQFAKQYDEGKSFYSDDLDRPWYDEKCAICRDTGWRMITYSGDAKATRCNHEDTHPVSCNCDTCSGTRYGK